MVGLMLKGCKRDYLLLYLGGVPHVTPSSCKGNALHAVNVESGVAGVDWMVFCGQQTSVRIGQLD